MDKNLPHALRRAAGFLEDGTRRLHPEIKWTPWYIEVTQEAADELERLKGGEW